MYQHLPDGRGKVKPHAEGRAKRRFQQVYARGAGAEHRIFGPSHVGELAARHGIAATATLPIDPEYAKAVDLGAVEKLDAPSLDVILDAVLA